MHKKDGEAQADGGENPFLRDIFILLHPRFDAARAVLHVLQKQLDSLRRLGQAFKRSNLKMKVLTLGRQILSFHSILGCIAVTSPSTISFLYVLSVAGQHDLGYNPRLSHIYLSEDWSRKLLHTLWGAYRNRCTMIFSTNPRSVQI